MNKILDVVLMIVLIIYIISPLDFIPDFIPVIGWMDDAAAFAIFLFLLGDLTGEGNALKKEVKHVR